VVGAGDVDGAATTTFTSTTTTISIATQISIAETTSIAETDRIMTFRDVEMRIAPAIALEEIAPIMIFPDAEVARAVETAPRPFRLGAIEATGSTIPNIGEVHLTVIGPRQTDSAAPHAVIPFPNARQVHANRFPGRGRTSAALAGRVVEWATDLVGPV
jgi:hypothetical protein